MKPLFNLLLAGTVTLCACTDLPAQDAKEHVSKQFTVNAKNTGSVLAIYNIYGSIKVEGYDGDKVQVEIDQKISAKSEEDLRIGKQEFKLEMEQQGDSIVVYIAAPYDSRPRTEWNKNDDRKRIKYKYNLDFVVKVPRSMRLRISTVNEGDIKVKDVFGDLFVNNVNGSLDIENAKGITKAVTVNGGIKVNYITNPPEASSYRTINGDITVRYKTDLNAELYFKSMNGEYFTDFDNAEPIQNAVEKNTETKSNSTVYKIRKDAGVRIGSGGKKFNFETLNGNVYIKKS